MWQQASVCQQTIVHLRVVVSQTLTVHTPYIGSPQLIFGQPYFDMQIYSDTYAQVNSMLQQQLDNLQSQFSVY